MSNGLSQNGTGTGCEDARVEQLLGIVREVLTQPDIAADDELMNHGGTSLSIVRILAMANRNLGLDINPRDLDGTITARSLARVAAIVTPTGTSSAARKR